MFLKYLEVITIMSHTIRDQNDSLLINMAT